MPSRFTSGEDAYAAVAPEDGRWSPWVKPASFAHFRGDYRPKLPDELPRTRLPALPPADGRFAVIIDLASDASVLAGMAAADEGFWPVPLFNATSPSGRTREAIDTTDLRSALHALAVQLRESPPPVDAPPCFLLDSHRLGTSSRSRNPSPGDYDNRWVTLPQDWPSATLMQSHGVTDAVVFWIGRGMADDLAHVLVRWQEAGIRLHRAAWDADQFKVIQVRRPSRFKSMFYRLLVLAGLRASAAGGFGGYVPHPDSGGGYG